MAVRDDERQGGAGDRPGDGRLDLGAAEEDLELYAEPPQAARVSRRAVAVIAAAVAGVLGAALVVGFGGGRGPARRGPGDADVTPVPQRVVDNAVLDGLPKDYTYDVNRAYAGVGYEERPAPAHAATRPSGPAGPTPEEAEAALREEERRRELERLRKEEDEARASPLIFPNLRNLAGRARDEGDRPGEADGRPEHRRRSEEEDPEYAAYLAERRHLDRSRDDREGLRRGPQADNERFLTEGAKVEPYLRKPLLRPASPYELKAGTVIPGMLVTGINTDLPGEVIGQVTEDVYDSATGEFLLVPQGSRLIGRYSSLVTNGQDRALVVWNRLIMPDGSSVVLDGMPGTDAAGRAGLADRVDRHLGRVGGAVALSTAITYAGNLARGGQRGGGRDGESSTDVVGDTVAQEGARVGQRLVDRELGVQPTITVRPGWPFRVLVNKDVVLAPYRGR